MEFESVEDDRDIETGFIHEKETVCDKLEPDPVFGRSSIFLKNKDVLFGKEKAFMRLACFEKRKDWRGTAEVLNWKAKKIVIYNRKKNQGARGAGWEEVINFDLYHLIWVMPT